MANFEPAISFPVVDFEGAAVLKELRIQDGVVLEASRAKVGKFASVFFLIAQFDDIAKSVKHFSFHRKNGESFSWETPCEYT